ncbi:MAG: glucose-6-phosphate isomerase, partial [Fusobacteriaceae bacterium]
MKKLKFDYKNSLKFFGEHEINYLKDSINLAAETLHEKKGAGNDFLGWINLPTDYDKAEFERIKKAAEKIKSNSDILLVVGIGGSYLGARAAIEFLSHTFYNNLSKEKRNAPEIYFVGQNISGTYLKHLLELLEGKDYSINVISKSGTTTEPALAFRVLKKEIEKKYGKEEAKNRIYATTDAKRGALKKLADEEGYETFVISDDIGGRFSVLKPVGLLPITVSGADIDKLMKGARDASKDFMADFES